MNFKPITLSDIEIINTYVAQKGSLSCQHSGAGLYYLSPKYQTQVAYDEHFFYVKQQRPGCGLVYFMPFGCGDLRQAVARVIAHHQAGEAAESPVFWGITDEMKDEFIQAVPSATLTPDRDWAEYIYDAQILVSLPGKKLHRQRSRLNHFMDDHHGRYTFEPITAQNADEVLAFQTEILKERLIKGGEESVESLKEEHGLIVNALRYFHDMRLIGGVLRVNGAICAYGFGAKVTDKTFDYICEKADRAYPGAALMIQRELIRHALEGFTWVNREEDIGLTGLRQAKERLKPRILLMKYTATL